MSQFCGNMIFRKWGGGVKGRLELFRKFIRFGRATRPLVLCIVRRQWVSVSTFNVWAALNGCSLCTWSFLAPINIYNPSLSLGWPPVSNGNGLVRQQFLQDSHQQSPNRQSTTSSQQQTVNNKESTTNSQQQTINNKQSTTRNVNLTILTSPSFKSGQN